MDLRPGHGMPWRLSQAARKAAMMHHVLHLQIEEVPGRGKEPKAPIPGTKTIYNWTRHKTYGMNYGYIMVERTTWD